MSAPLGVLIQIGGAYAAVAALIFFAFESGLAATCIMLFGLALVWLGRGRRGASKLEFASIAAASCAHQDTGVALRGER